MNLISVVIPSRNRKHKLIHAVESALCSKLVNEVIVVDDSSDPPLDKGLFGHLKIDNKLRIIKNNNVKGAQGARITGAISSKNDFILFLDSDDLIIEDGVTKLHQALKNNIDIAFVYSNVLHNDKISNFLRIDGDGFHSVLKNLSLCSFSGLMIRKSLVPWGDLDLTLPAWQDDDFCITICRLHNVKFVDTISARMRVSADSISKSKQKQFIGLAILIHKWKNEILSEFGIGRLLLWRARLLSLFLLIVAEDMRCSTDHTGVVRFLFKTTSYTINLFGKIIHIFVRPFFDRCYA